MKVLTEVLLSNAGSPLRKALIDSGLGSALADGSGLHDDYKEVVFGAGLKGIEPSDAGKVERVVLDTLEKLADQGVDKALVDAAIHHLEFEKRERSNAGFPYALRLVFAALLANQYRALLTVVPDTELEEGQRRRELDQLAAIEAGLSDAERARIVEDAL